MCVCSSIDLINRYDAAYDSVLGHTTKAELAAFWKHFDGQPHANPAVTENPVLDGTETQNCFTLNPMVNNSALLTASIRDLHVNDADTSRAARTSAIQLAAV